MHLGNFVHMATTQIQVHNHDKKERKGFDNLMYINFEFNFGIGLKFEVPMCPSHVKDCHQISCCSQFINNSKVCQWQLKFNFISIVLFCYVCFKCNW